MHALCDGPRRSPLGSMCFPAFPTHGPVSVSFISPPLCLISHPLTVAEGVGKGGGTVVALVQTRVSVFLRGEG